MTISQYLSAISAALLCGTAALAVPALFAADESPSSELRARQLFYTNKPVTQRPRPAGTRSGESKADESKPAATDAPTATDGPVNKQPQAESEAATPQIPSKAPYLALRYSVLQPGVNGTLDETDPEKTFHSLESFRLKLTSNSSGFLYVVLQGSLGNWDVLYPSPALGEPHQRIIAGEPLVIPSDTNFQFDKDPGTERLFIVLSRSPEASFDQLIQSVKNHEGNGTSGRGGIENVQMAGLRQTLAPRGIIRERVTRTATGGENAVYVANVSLNQNSRVITDVVLKHE